MKIFRRGLWEGTAANEGGRGGSPCDRAVSALSGLALAAALALPACGGSQPAAETPAAEPSESESSTAAEEQPAAAEEGWGGEDVGGQPAPSEGSGAGAAAPGAAAPSTGTSEAAPPVDEKAPETRTTQVIQDVVSQNRAKVRACYDAVQKKLPDLKGDLFLKFTLNAEGGVKSIEQDLEKSTLKSPEVAKCAMDEIKSWKFPPSSRGMDTTVNYPFNFKPKK